MVAPRYAPAEFDGLIDSAVVYPLTRALYGKRIHGQLGLDFGFSARVAARWRQLRRDGAPRGPPAWLIPQASPTACRSARRTSARAWRRQQRSAGPQRDRWPRCSGSLFVDIERRAAFWQRSSARRRCRVFGAPAAAGDEDGGVVDVQPLIESFRLAYRNLQDVWGLVLPPATLRRAEAADACSRRADFRLADDLWARIVYDFALATGSGPSTATTCWGR